MGTKITPRAVWLPFEVTDLDSAVRFYESRFALSRVDEWDRDGERGVVFRIAGDTCLELVSANAERRAPVAYELADEQAVDEAFTAWAPTGADLIAPPHCYPRGHYGFEVRSPAGAELMIWSEK